MNEKEKILLPGADQQIKLLLAKVKLEGPKVLVIGAASERIAEILIDKYDSVMDLIVDETESLLNSNLILGSNDKIKVRMMDFKLTDFESSTFDLIYAQGSISGVERNKIVKEIRRILKPKGLLYSGEIVKLERNVPQFVEDIFSASGLLPLFINDLENYYKDRSLKLVWEANLSESLTNYYKLNSEKLFDAQETLSENERKYYKKLLKKISHETGAYLKLGADKYIGFKVILMENLKK